MINKYWIEASETLFDRLEEIGLEPLIERDKETYAYYISDGWFCGATKHFIELECTLTPHARMTEAGEIETLTEPFIRVHTPTQEEKDQCIMRVDISVPGEPFTVTEVETDVCPKVIAKYAGKDPESMRQLKRKWKSTATGLWIHYVRSYKYSLGGQDDGSI